MHNGQLAIVVKKYGPNHLRTLATLLKAQSLLNLGRLDEALKTLQNLCIEERGFRQRTCKNSDSKISYM